MASRKDIHTYLSELEDVPGTLVFTAKRARVGFNLNQFAMSLMKVENRTRFKANEAAYLDEWGLTDAQKHGVLMRDYGKMMEEGGNIYFLAKLVSTDELPFIKAVSSMSGMSTEAYESMMVAGGRSVAGLRSRKEHEALTAVLEAAVAIPNAPVIAGPAS
jgi:protocatechuate 4,5-dioxygenase alpha chain